MSNLYRPSFLLALVLAPSALGAQIHIQLPKIEPPKIDIPNLPIPDPKKILEKPPAVVDVVTGGLAGATAALAAEGTGASSETLAVLRLASSPVLAIDPKLRSDLPGPCGELLEQAVTAGKSITSVALKTAIQPYETQGKLGMAALEMRPPNETWPTVKEDWAKTARAAAKAGVEGAKLGAAATDASTGALEELAGKSLGDAGRQFVRAATQDARLASAVGLTGAKYLDLIAQGKDPAMLLAAPLAIELQKAYDMHKGTARPLPEGVREHLSGVFDADILARARWTVGQVEISLPNALNRVNQVFTGEHAVTVDDLIIFSVAPSLDHLPWWAHEIRHTAQYKELGGIDAFAWAYVRNNQEVEGNARAYEEPARKAQGPTTQSQGKAPESQARLPSQYDEVPLRAATCLGEKGVRQSIQVQSGPKMGLPCSVTAVVDSEGLLVVDTIATARDNYEICTSEAGAAIQRLATNGWLCQLTR